MTATISDAAKRALQKIHDEHGYEWFTVGDVSSVTNAEHYVRRLYESGRLQQDYHDPDRYRVVQGVRLEKTVNRRGTRR